MSSSLPPAGPQLPFIPTSSPIDLDSNQLFVDSASGVSSSHPLASPAAIDPSSSPSSSPAPAAANTAGQAVPATSVSTSTPTPAATTVAAAPASGPGDHHHQSNPQQTASPRGSTSQPVVATEKPDEATTDASATSDPAGSPSAEPVVAITLLLTNGARHPLRIDEKYLRRRNVALESADPFEINVYTLKELIFDEWREDWDQKPTSPSSIRLIHFGRMLEDKSPLSECRLNQEGPNVVHMTVKPPEVPEEEDAKATKVLSVREADTDEREVGCRCVIF